MFTEERYTEILRILSVKKTVSAVELSKSLRVSISTIRRDLLNLDAMGKLVKVHGGATLPNLTAPHFIEEEDVVTKKDHCIEHKNNIGRSAAQLIDKDNFIYIDAGTTTFLMLKHLPKTNSVFVTNGLQHAITLSSMGYKVHLLGGSVKANTQAVVGIEAIRAMANCNFTMGFFGTNGISTTAGYTTPDFSEASIKAEAFERCERRFILADSTKFDRIFPVTFAQLKMATIITNNVPEEKYRDLTDIIKV